MEKNNKDLTKNILEKIDKENITQIPRWYFVSKNTLFWTLTILSILFSAVAISLIILHLLQIDIPIARRASGSIIHHIILFAPYLWIVLFIIFASLVLSNFIHTKYGYRHAHIFVITISLIASITLGIVFYFVGIAQNTDHYIGKLGIPHYQNAQARRQHIWLQPNRGLLVGIPLGTINAEENMQSFALIDPTGKTWTIDTQKLSSQDLAIAAVASKIAIVGVRQNAQNFDACRIVPWSTPKDKQRIRKKILQFAPKNKKLREINLFELRNNLCGQQN